MAGIGKGSKVVARLPHKYDKVHRDRGEVYMLIGGRNDGLLERHKYFFPFDAKIHEEILCDSCGRRFATPQARDAHKRKPNCFDDSRGPTRAETAELIGADPDKFKLEEDEADQRAKDFAGDISAR